MISYPLPSWEPMNTVPFMYAESTWDEWSTGFIELMLGLGMFLLSISAITREAPWMSFRFDSNHPLQVLQFKFIKYSAMSSVFIASVLIVIYSFGANLYACGTPWLRTTIAYVSDAPLIEWLTACMYCVFVTYVVYFITKIRIRHGEYVEGNKTWMMKGEMGMRVMIWRTRMQDDTQASGMARIKSEIECQSVESRRVSAFKQLTHMRLMILRTKGDDEHHLTWSQYLIVVIIYLPALCLLSTFTIIDAISKAVPPDKNTFGFSATQLTFVSTVVGPVLFLVKSYVLPLVTDSTIQFVTGSTSSWISTRMIATRMRFNISARLFLTIIVPCVSTILMSQNCLGLWLLAWTPCQTPSDFDAYLTITSSIRGAPVITFEVMSGSSICGSNYRLLLYTRILQLWLPHLAISTMYLYP